MEEKRGILKFFKKLIKKEMKSSMEDESTDIDKKLDESIEIQSIEVLDLKDTIENEITQSDLIENNYIQEENDEDEINELENLEELYKVDSHGDNLNFERVTSNMIGIKNIGQSPCDITNNLKQAILKVDKSLITQEQLERIGIIVNLGHIDNYEVVDVAFKYNHEIQNPCGEGTVLGEALLKAVVLVGAVSYSWILYDTITNEIVYDGMQDSVTAYSVYDIVKFEEDVRPKNVTAKFTPAKLTKVDVIDDENLDFYIFKVSGTVDIVGV